VSEDFCYWCPFFDGGKCDRCPYIYIANESDEKVKEPKQKED